jgi:hypothetical protein
VRGWVHTPCFSPQRRPSIKWKLQWWLHPAGGAGTGHDAIHCIRRTAPGRAQLGKWCRACKRDLRVRYCRKFLPVPARRQWGIGGRLTGLSMSLSPEPVRELDFSETITCDLLFCKCIYYLSPVIPVKVGIQRISLLQINLNGFRLETCQNDGVFQGPQACGFCKNGNFVVLGQTP